MTEAQQKIFDIQCETTKKLMLAQATRSESDDKDYISNIRFTPILEAAQCVKEDGSVDLNVRHITTEDYDLHQGMRYIAGERIASLRKELAVSTLTEAKREKASNAFMHKLSFEVIKDRFKSIMKDLIKPDYAHIVAEALKRNL